METTIKIDSLADLNLNLLNKVLKEIVSSVGKVEITIKSQQVFNERLLQWKREVDAGCDLYEVSFDDLEDLTNTNSINEEKVPYKIRRKAGQGRII